MQGGKNYSFVGPLEREHFKIRHLEHFSFAYYSSCGQGKKQDETRKDKVRFKERDSKS